MSRISKVVIPAAGLGTRLLSATKEQPKEMLPIFYGSKSGELTVKPIVQVIFEQLYEVGFREFYFIVGRSKRAIEDHFTPDYEYLKALERKGKTAQADELGNFYGKLESSSIAWINQPSPLGFGHAVLMSKNLIGNEHFLVHAGDTVILSDNNRHLTELTKLHLSGDGNCTFVIREVEDPQQFGIVNGDSIGDNLLKVTEIEEKPANPRTNLAIMPVYAFDPIIFKALQDTKPGKSNEIQLTDGIKKLKEWELSVMATRLLSSDLWIDVGSPETYWSAQYQTYNYFKKIGIAKRISST